MTADHNPQCPSGRTARITHLFIAPHKGADVIALPSIRVVKNCGVVGDRWYRPRWLYPLRHLNAWRKDKRFGCTNLTLITLADIAAANATLKDPFTPAQLRRNVVLDGDVDLNALLGVTFRVGPIWLRGDNLCTPCALPVMRAGQGDARTFNMAFGHPKFGGTNRGGLRAQILTTGTLHIGDPLCLPTR